MLGWAGRKKRQKRKAKAAAERQGAETNAGDDLHHVSPDPNEAGSKPLADMAALRQDHAASDPSVSEQHNPAARGSQQSSVSLHAAVDDDPAPQPGIQSLPRHSRPSRQFRTQQLSSQTPASPEAPEAPAAAAAAEALGRVSAHLEAAVLQANQYKANSPARTGRSKHDSGTSDQVAQQHAGGLGYSADRGLDGGATEAARSPSPAPSSASLLADDGASQFLVSTQASQLIISSDIISQRSFADPDESQEPDDKDGESSVDELPSVLANSEATNRNSSCIAWPKVDQSPA